MMNSLIWLKIWLRIWQKNKKTQKRLQILQSLLCLNEFKMVWLSGEKKRTPALEGRCSGACDPARTDDLRITNALHYHCATSATLILYHIFFDFAICLTKKIIFYLALYIRACLYYNYIK